MWTGNYNDSATHKYRYITLAGSMWTGNYNLSFSAAHKMSTLAGSMWTGNYNYNEDGYSSVRL